MNDSTSCRSSRILAGMHLFFDLDGTLTDPSTGICACLHHAASRLGTEVTGDPRRFIGPPLREAFAEILETDDPARQEEGVRYYRERYATVGLFQNAVYAGITDVLSRLAGEEHSLRVVTSKPKIYADQIIDHFGLRRFFPVVYGAELDGRHSTKADLLAHVIHAEGASPARAIMIGDRKHDVLGARVHGIPTIGVLWGFGSEKELRESGASQTVSRVEELESAIADVADRVASEGREA